MKPHSCRRRTALHPSRLLRAAVVWALAALFVAPASLLANPSAQTSPSQIGEISLVLGRAYIESSIESSATGGGKSAAGKQSTQRTRQLAVTGAPVSASDRIVTDSNGHVHIRFIDDALVSVRPDSRLDIVQYEYHPERPQDSVIRLYLEEGVTRSISGDGASSARERFRLNTPIAAIGVRGTDFVVSASSQAVRAQVNEGAIVMAPFSSECFADGLGPCLADAVELTGNSLQMLEMDDGDATPRLLADSVLHDPEAMNSDAEQRIAQTNVEDRATASDMYLENVTSRRIEAEVAGISRPAPPLDFMPSSPVASSVLSERELLWGRWTEGYGVDERLTMPQVAARVDRDVTMGKGDYILFRDGGGRERVDAGLGAISFELASAQAFYRGDTGVVAMAVSGGALDVNFDTGQFSTALNLSHRLTGRVDFTAAGWLTERGFFVSRSDSHELRGTTSLDGREAGYLFEQKLEAGDIHGLTLWDKR